MDVPPTFTPPDTGGGDQATAADGAEERYGWRFHLGSVVGHVCDELDQATVGVSRDVHNELINALVMFQNEQHGRLQDIRREGSDDKDSPATPKVLALQRLLDSIAWDWRLFVLKQVLVSPAEQATYDYGALLRKYQTVWAGKVADVESAQRFAVAAASADGADSTTATFATGADSADGTGPDVEGSGGGGDSGGGGAGGAGAGAEAPQGTTSAEMLRSSLSRASKLLLMQQVRAACRPQSLLALA
jgi:hypothetical protein